MNPKIISRPSIVRSAKLKVHARSNLVSRGVLIVRRIGSKMMRNARNWASYEAINLRTEEYGFIQRRIQRILADTYANTNGITV